MSSRLPSCKQCVTCQYWGGQRKVSPGRDRAEYGSEHDKGECVGGGYNGLQKTISGSCTKWEKWGVLK
jgi:hypothetical protein